jgi:hypothetical protein
LGEFSGHNGGYRGDVIQAKATASTCDRCSNRPRSIASHKRKLDMNRWDALEMLEDEANILDYLSHVVDQQDRALLALALFKHRPV